MPQWRVFTSAERDSLRSELLAIAREDPRITGVAITGSASVGKEDRWSDIDLAFGVDSAWEEVVAAFTDEMRRRGSIDELDVHNGSWLYRVFLLPNMLQVDLAFAPAADFGAKAPTFKLIHGRSNQIDSPTATNSSVARGLVGWGWLYALHVRSAIARRRYLQAELMISGMRNKVVALACLRHGLAHSEGRGAHELPPAVQGALGATLVRSLDADELRRAFVEMTRVLVDEINWVNGAPKELATVVSRLARDV